MMTGLPHLLLAVAAINVATFVAFWRDKAKAVAGERRIAERDLLCLALIGGTPAAFCARRVFRHKTRKQPFSTQLQIILTMQIGGLTGWFLI